MKPMHHFLLPVLLPALLLGWAAPAPAPAYWPTTLEENLVISAVPGVIEREPVALPYPGGRTLVVYDHAGLGNCYQIIDRCGEFQFPQPVQVAPGFGGDYDLPPKAVLDGNGGAFIARKMVAPYSGIWAQHLDSMGNRLWGDSGVRMLPFADHQFDICADSQGGMWVAVTPGNGCGTGHYLWVQRADGAGNLAFADSGLVAVYSWAGLSYPYIAPDSDGGCIIVWEDLRSGSLGSFYAQHFDPTGVPLWPQDLHLCDNVGQPWTAKIIPDGQGGVIVQANPGGADCNTVWCIRGRGDSVEPGSRELVL